VEQDYGQSGARGVVFNEQISPSARIASYRKSDSRAVFAIQGPNAELRPREHLTEREVEKLIAAAKGNRWGQRERSLSAIAAPFQQTAS
jgi:hypothetical protein